MTPEARPLADVVVPRERIGDALITLIVAHNLRGVGRPVAVASTVLRELDEWFPELELRTPAELSGRYFARAIHQNASTLSVFAPEADERVLLSGHELFRQRKARVDVYVDACAVLLGIAQPERVNGLVVPERLEPRRAYRRVVVHPFSREDRKSWTLRGFIRVADALRERGFDPVFLSQPGRSCEPAEFGDHSVEQFESLAEVAEFVCESGYFIGNDSGIGHLASCLGIPTTTLFVRPNLARRWRPAWTPGRVVLPRWTIPSTALKYRLWKHLVSVENVVAEFLRTATC